MSIKDTFYQDLNREIALDATIPAPVVTEEDIAGLPEPVQRYFRLCGYLNRERVTNILVEYRNLYLKIWEGSDFAPIQALHYANIRPSRGVFLTSRIFGFMPLAANSWLLNGRYSAKARIMAIFPVASSEGQQQAESTLADILGDMVLMPGLALQPCITWVPVNDRTCRAIMSINGLEVSGIFRFKETGECFEYDTEDKSYTMKDNTSIKVRNTMLYEDYRDEDGLRVPARLRTFWHLATGDFEYAKGEYGTIRRNVRTPVEPAF